MRSVWCDHLQSLRIGDASAWRRESRHPPLKCTPSHTVDWSNHVRTTRDKHAKHLSDPSCHEPSYFTNSLRTSTTFWACLA